MVGEYQITVNGEQRTLASETPVVSYRQLADVLEAPEGPLAWRAADGRRGVLVRGDQVMLEDGLAISW
jgi:hypothetical protein